MTEIFENGKTKEITETFEESLEILNAALVDLGEKEWNEKDAREHIKGGETVAHLEEIARDYHSDSQTEKAELREHFRNWEPEEEEHD